MSIRQEMMKKENGVCVDL